GIVGAAVFGQRWLSITTILVTVTSPVLVTATVKAITPPGEALVPGQSLATASRGVVRTGQLLFALPLTGLLQTSCPLTLTMSVMEQTSAGTGSVPLTMVPSPGARRGIVATGVFGAG